MQKHFLLRRKRELELYTVDMLEKSLFRFKKPLNFSENETIRNTVSSRKPDFWNMTRALCFQPIIGRNQIEGANHERPHRAVAGKWQKQRGSADKMFSPWKPFFDGNFFKCPLLLVFLCLFVGFLFAVKWKSTIPRNC